MIGSRFLTLAALAALATLAVGCARHDGDLAHVMRIAVTSDPSSLSPLVAFAQTDIGDDLLIARTLVGLDDAGHLTPELITRVPSRANGDISADGKRITYHLKPNLRFADGVALTSADVRFTYRALLDPSNHAAGEAPYLRIAAVDTPDTNTVVLHLRSRWDGAVAQLFAESDFAIGILPAHAFPSTRVVGTDWEDHAFASGPFRVTSWRRGDRIVLAPNPYYVPAPKLERLEIRFIPEHASALGALRAGDVDVAEIGPDQAPDVQHASALRLDTNPLNGYIALTLQTRRSPTDDLEVRRAIADALDYRELAHATHDLYPPIASIFGPSVVRWRRAALEPFVHDPARAAREFDAAGWRLADGARAKDGRKMELALAYNSSDSTAARESVIIQRDLADLGVAVDVKAYPYAELTAADGPERNGRFSLAITGLIGGSDPEASAAALTCSSARPGGANFGQYCSHDFDAKLADQTTAPSVARRDADWAAIERRLRTDLPLIPLHQYATFWGVSERVAATYRHDPLDFPLHAENWDTR